MQLTRRETFHGFLRKSRNKNPHERKKTGRYTSDNECSNYPGYGMLFPDLPQLFHFGGRFRWLHFHHPPMPAAETVRYRNELSHSCDPLYVEVTCLHALRSSNTEGL